MKSTQEERDETLRDRNRSRDLASAKWRSRSSFLLPLRERREMRRREIAIGLATPRDRDRSCDLASAKWSSRSSFLLPLRERREMRRQEIAIDLAIWLRRNGALRIQDSPSGEQVVKYLTLIRSSTLAEQTAA
ncbi:hypothetical protein MRB53_022184 [Persea americana]|uniref:Uncharacterized protein n=1 Tax=Persea americana TaxID=3435 RepID=A0ACC2L627_PERAE|nr:hypothetical protein MRB53_022184 [Persea americana]